MISIFLLSLCMINLDTGIVQHTKDGLLNEWPAERFTEDKGTGILYAMDNDRENLYVAVKIADPWTQTQMMRAGMRTFFDMKGKHKENKGIEFPVKKEYGGAPMKSPPDVKEERMTSAPSLLSLKLFGIDDPGEESKEQSLEMEGSLQLIFSWDSTDIMQLEYTIPLKKLETDLASLNQKQISVGWKINAVEAQDLAGSRSGGTTTGRVVTVPAGQRPGMTTGGFGQTGTNNSGKQTGLSKMMKDQLLWAKYTFTY